MSIKITYKDATRLAQYAVAIDRPLFLFGPPGNGKTALGYELERLNPRLKYFVTNVSQLDSLDFRGLPDLNSDHDKTVWRIPEMFEKINALAEDDEVDYVLVGLDELSGALDSIHGVLYQMVQTKRVGPHQLSDKVRFISMGNLPKHGSGIDRRPNPIMLNRGMVAELDSIEPEVWLQWAARERINPIVREAIRNNGTLLNSKDDNHLATATPRSWETASLVLSHLLPQLTDLTEAGVEDFWKTNGVVSALTASVGGQATSHIVSMLAFLDQIPTVDEIEAKGSSAHTPKHRVAAAVATFNMAGHLAEATHRVNVIEYVKALAKKHGDDLLSMFVNDVVQTQTLTAIARDRAAVKKMQGLIKDLGVSLSELPA